jgi:hypothetical protein
MVREDAISHQRGSAAGACHMDGLGATIIAGLDIELNLLSLAQAAVAVGLDAGLQQYQYVVQHSSRYYWY